MHKDVISVSVSIMLLCLIWLSLQLSTPSISHDIINSKVNQERPLQPGVLFPNLEPVIVSYLVLCYDLQMVLGEAYVAITVFLSL